jgi:hypothetical protein
MPFALDPGGRHKRMIARCSSRMLDTIFIICPNAIVRPLQPRLPLPFGRTGPIPRWCAFPGLRPLSIGGPNGDFSYLARSNSLRARGIGPFGHAPAKVVTRLTRPPISVPADGRGAIGWRCD